MKLIKLEQTCFACPEQWEGVTDEGSTVYAEERHGFVRVEVDNVVIFTSDEGTALDALIKLFDIPNELFWSESAHCLTCKIGI
jgi:hypothetical protein